MPVLLTAVTENTPDASKCRGISSDGCSTLTGRGVCRTTGRTPTIADINTSDGKGYGAAVSIQALNLSIFMVSIPAGSFTMGSPTTEAYRDIDENLTK